jgi:sulfotransferase family protein
MALGGDPEKNPCKYIYIARNPKDVAVSYYIFESGKSWSGFYSGPWAHWLKMFLEGRVQRGDWFDHVLSWWEHRHAPNILFLKYEDLVRNLPQELAKIEKYLGYILDAGTRELIVSKTQFATMQKDQFAGLKEIKEFKGFFRRGHIGSWKELFTPSQSEMFDEVYAERMKGSGLVFDFDY